MFPAADAEDSLTRAPTSPDRAWRTATLENELRKSASPTPRRASARLASRAVHSAFGPDTATTVTDAAPPLSLPRPAPPPARAPLNPGSRSKSATAAQSPSAVPGAHSTPPPPVAKLRDLPDHVITTTVAGGLRGEAATDVSRVADFNDVGVVADPAPAATVTSAPLSGVTLPPTFTGTCSPMERDSTTSAGPGAVAPGGGRPPSLERRRREASTPRPSPSQPPPSVVKVRDLLGDAITMTVAPECRSDAATDASHVVDVHDVTGPADPAPAATAASCSPTSAPAAPNFAGHRSPMECELPASASSGTDAPGEGRQSLPTNPEQGRAGSGCTGAAPLVFTATPAAIASRRKPFALGDAPRLPVSSIAVNRASGGGASRGSPSTAAPTRGDARLTAAPKRELSSLTVPGVGALGLGHFPSRKPGARERPTPSLSETRLRDLPGDVTAPVAAPARRDDEAMDTSNVADVNDVAVAAAPAAAAAGVSDSLSRATSTPNFAGHRSPMECESLAPASSGADAPGEGRHFSPKRRGRGTSTPRSSPPQPPLPAFHDALGVFCDKLGARSSGADVGTIRVLGPVDVSHASDVPVAPSTLRAKRPTQAPVRLPLRIANWHVTQTEDAASGVEAWEFESGPPTSHGYVDDDRRCKKTCEGVIDEDAGPLEEADHRAWQGRAGLDDSHGERAGSPSRHGHASDTL